MVAQKVIIKSSKNNVHVSLTDARGLLLYKRSCGMEEGLTGNKRGTAYAGEVLGQTFARELLDRGYTSILKVVFVGFGPGRFSAIKSLMASFKVDTLIEQTTAPHNGCRRRKNPRK